MRVKAVPTAPDGVDVVFEARRAVPLVAKPEADCCARLRERLDLPGRDDARTWLTFLRGLGLVGQTEHGFARTEDRVGPDELASRLLEGVYGGRELLAILAAAEVPLDEATAVDRFTTHVPAWERRREPATWRETWQARVVALLDWLLLLDIAEHRDGGAVVDDPERFSRFYDDG